MQIRNYKEKDCEKVREICFLTAKGKNYEKNKELVCTLFCDYYIEHEPQNCFVLTAEHDEAVGYIICAENYETYIKKYLEFYYSKVKKLSKFEAFIKKCEKLYYKKIALSYPAHLHIDILSAYQGQGYGKALIRKLLDNLNDKNVKGIHLTVSSVNLHALKLYYKLGFKVIKNIFGKALVLGKKL